MQSSKPRKQRLFRFNAPMHVRQSYAHAHVAKEAAEKLGIKRRSIQVRRGDTVKVMTGSNKGKSGKVNRVDLRRSAVYIEGISRKTAKGKELLLPIKASNVYITAIDTGDKLRREKLGVKQ